MRILWITNILFPEASNAITGNNTLKASGGWMLGAAHNLIQNDNVELHIATVSKLVSELQIIKGTSITYYVIPFGKGNLVYNKSYEQDWKQINTLVRPDVVHIHGSEFTHGLAYVNSCGNKNVVVSIQGLRKAYAPYYLSGIKFKELISSYTFHDFIRGCGLISGRSMFEKLGELETDLFSKVNHIIGRTSWDKAHAWAFNDKAHYYLCNETLRDSFYSSKKWAYDSCKKHTIFLSQGGKPIKGLHLFLKALPSVIKHYPDTQVRIAGEDITRSKESFALLKITGYGLLVKKIIKKFNLAPHIQFLGNLDEKEMVSEYLNANLFVMPSTIENSPNSLGEAQILGTPHIAAYVGGACDMMIGNEANLYRFDEIDMLAFKIKACFDDYHKSVDMINAAEQRHNPQRNCEQLISIYNRIIES